MIRENASRRPTKRNALQRQVDQAQRLDIAELRRTGLFKLPAGEVRTRTLTWDHPLFRAFPVHLAVVADASGEPAGIVLHHVTLDRTYERVTYPVRITSTTPHLGGKRFWFVCPGPTEDLHCGTRRRILYQPYMGRRFACRSCHQLSYRDPWAAISDRALEALGDASRTAEGRRAIRKAWRRPRRSRRK